MKKILFFSSLILVLFYNFVFFEKSFAVFKSIPFMISLGVLLFLFIALLQTIFYSKYTFKPFMIYLFITGSLSLYFMQKYGVVIDDKMIQNIFETDISEASDLFNYEVLGYFLVLGLLPSFIIYKLKINYLNIKQTFLFKLKYIPLLLLLIVANVYLFSKAYTSFFREYKPLRYYTNPTYPLYGLGKFIQRKYFIKKLKFKKVGGDAKLLPKEGKPKLFIFVTGEAARADHFSLNGYKRDTNPTLKKDKEITSFKNFYSCGTETAVSVPCMFSPLTRSNYKDSKAKSMSSLIDVLNYAGVRLLWIDNNSDSKGVAVRIKNYKNIKDSCHGECRDFKMLDGLDKFVKTPKTTFIVLHQMGSHGPEYYKRYDKKYEKFKPVCQTNQLNKCTRQSIINAYDNTIVATDAFLTKVKEFLKSHQDKYKVALWYVADHGESLGEKGIYLHGMPYFIAPDAQKHPASIIWFGKDFGISNQQMKKLKDKKLSQDYIFSSILDAMDVNTSIYNKKLDLYKQ